MHKIIVVTSASRGFGRLASTALARAGHTVYASMHETTGRNAATAAEIGGFAKQLLAAALTSSTAAMQVV